MNGIAQRCLGALPVHLGLILHPSQMEIMPFTEHAEPIYPLTFAHTFRCLDCMCHLCDFLFGKIVHHLFLTFKILIHLEFIWVCKGSDFIFFRMDIHLCQHHVFYNLPFPAELKYSLCHIYIFSYILESIFGCSIIFHLSIPLPVPY